MTTPVTKPDIISGCTTYLRSQPDVLSVVSVFPIDGQLVPGLFGYSNWVALEGTGKTCAILTNQGGWTGPNLHNTLRFPLIGLNIWADPIRDDGNNISDPGECMRRLDAAFEVFDKHLHRVAGETQMWGPIRTVACARMTEPMTYRVPDGDGIVRLQVSYAVTQG